MLRLYEFFEHFFGHKEGTHMNKLDSLIVRLDIETNNVAGVIEGLIREMRDGATEDHLTQLQAIADRLKSLGENKHDPIPVPKDVPPTE